MKYEPATEMSDPMLAVLCRRIFQKRDAGKDGLQQEGMTRDEVLNVLDEAERRGIVEMKK